MSPAGSPRVTDDPVRNVVEYSVTDDDHFVIEVLVIFLASRIAEHSIPSQDEMTIIVLAMACMAECTCNRRIC